MRRSGSRDTTVWLNGQPFASGRMSLEEIVAKLDTGAAERVAAEEALHASQGRFRSLVLHASDLITVVDAEANLQYVSPSVSKMLGFAPEELVAGVDDLRALVSEHDLAVVAMLGIGAYRTGFRRRTARQGVQEETLGGAELRVLPNPSGLNAGSTLADLATAFREAGVAAGILDRDILDREEAER